MPTETVIPIRAIPSDTGLRNRDIASRLLRDVAAAVAVLQQSGQCSAIDLKQVPRMTADTYQWLKDCLSTGETQIQIRSDVEVHITETGFPGVWWLTHHSDSGDIVTEVIEIAPLPAILKPHRVEIVHGHQRLERLLESLASASPSPGQLAKPPHPPSCAPTPVSAEHGRQP